MKAGHARAEALIHKQSMLDAQKSELGGKNRVLRMQKNTLRKARAWAVEANVVAIEKLKVVQLKEWGVISDTSWEIIREMVKLGVPVDHVDGVLHAVAESLGVSVKDSVSACMVPRIVLEGGVATKLQLAHSIITTNGKLALTQ